MDSALSSPLIASAEHMVNYETFTDPRPPEIKKSHFPNDVGLIASGRPFCTIDENGIAPPISKSCYVLNVKSSTFLSYDYFIWYFSLYYEI